jgi:hypothetical protein
MNSFPFSPGQSEGLGSPNSELKYIQHKRNKTTLIN